MYYRLKHLFTTQQHVEGGNLNVSQPKVLRQQCLRSRYYNQTNPALLKPISNKFQQQNSKVVFNVTTTPQILKAVYIRTSYLRTLIANLFPRV